MSRRMWTLEEEETLRRLHPHKTLNEIAAALGKKKSAVATKACVMGLKKTKPWTTKDIQLLRDIYPVTPTDEVAKRMGRTVAYIGAKASELGIAKTVRTRRHAQDGLFSQLGIGRYIDGGQA